MAKITADKSTLETTEIADAKATDAVLLFGKTNYILVLLGIALIALGFILMSGGGSSDPNVFDADAIYNSRRITLAPILIVLGFIIEIIAIVKKP